MLCVALVMGVAVAAVGGEECRPRPLGLMDNTIRDWQLAASSVVSRAMDPDCAVKASLNYITVGLPSWSWVDCCRYLTVGTECAPLR